MKNNIQETQEKPNTPNTIDTLNTKQEYDLIVISGPSGVGKTTILKSVLEKNIDISKKLKHIPTYTTRKPRKDEIDGIDYHFINDQLFDQFMEKDKFKGVSITPLGRYGIRISEIRLAILKGYTPIIIVDKSGLDTLKTEFENKGSKNGGKICSLYIFPPSVDLLKARLAHRGDEQGEDQGRGKDLSSHLYAQKLIDESKDYNYVVTNDDLQKAVNDVLDYILF